MYNLSIISLVFLFVTGALASEKPSVAKKSVHWHPDVKGSVSTNENTNAGEKARLTEEQALAIIEQKREERREEKIAAIKSSIATNIRLINEILDTRIREVDGKIELSKDLQLDRIPGYKKSLDSNVALLRDLGLDDQEISKIRNYQKVLDNLEKYNRGTPVPSFFDDDATRSGSGAD